MNAQNTVENIEMGSGPRRLFQKPRLAPSAPGKFLLVLTIIISLTKLTALSDPPVTHNGVPFRGSIRAVETSVAQPPTLFVDGSGSGNATQLGRFTVSYEVEVNLATRASIGSATFAAANGDTILAEFLGQGNPIEGTDFSFIVESYVILEGTGRFAGASGTFTVERLLDRATGVTSGSFEGTIVRSKAK